jgi:hypothetical protein
MFSTTEKGDLGVSAVIAEASKKGYSILFPLSGNKRYDLVLEKEGKFERIQVKYVEGNSEVIKAKAYYNSGKSNKEKKYTSNDIEALVIFDKNSNKCYYIPSSLLNEGRTIFYLRLMEPKNKQSKKINWAKDFEW